MRDGGSGETGPFGPHPTSMLTVQPRNHEPEDAVLPPGNASGAQTVYQQRRDDFSTQRPGFLLPRRMRQPANLLTTSGGLNSYSRAVASSILGGTSNISDGNCVDVLGGVNLTAIDNYSILPRPPFPQ